jgi:hypothetical protein
LSIHFEFGLLQFFVLAMSKPLSKSPHKTTPLTQYQGSQENASVQGPPLSYPRLPVYTETIGVSKKDMTPPPACQGTQSSGIKK